MERDTLRHIPPPGKDRTPLDVAKELVKLYREEYKLTIAKVCSLFCCERQWAEDFILGNVEHIYITQYFRKYIIESLGGSMTKAERHDFTYSFYFISVKDLIRFYNETAAASQKTKMIDIALYRNLSSDFNAVVEEKSRHAGMKPSKKEKIRHLEKMKELLSEEGKALYDQSREGKFEWVDVSLPKLKPFSKKQSDRLISTALYAKKIDFGANTAYKQLSRAGAVRIKFGGKMLWQLPDYAGTWLIPVQA